MDYTENKIRRAFLAAVRAEWSRPVEVEEHDDRVTEYFRGIGWGWAIDKHCPGGTYDEQVRRTTDAPLDYCGIGPAWVLVHRLGQHLEDQQCVPVRLRRGIARHVLPSTYRANSVDHWDRADTDPPAQIPPEDIEPGHLVTVVTSHGRGYGDHFAVARERPGDGELATIEWNATGELGDGREGRGVVRRSRLMDDVRRVYPILPRHLEHKEE